MINKIINEILRFIILNRTGISDLVMFTYFLKILGNSGFNVGSLGSIFVSFAVYEGGFEGLLGQFGLIEPAERYTASPHIGISAAESGRI